MLQNFLMMTKGLSKKIVDFLFPATCEGCGVVGSYLCERCAKKNIVLNKKQICHVCKCEIIENERYINTEKKVIEEVLRNCEDKFQENVLNLKLVHLNCKEKTNLDGVFVVAKYSKFIENFIGDIKYEFYFAMIPDIVKVMIKYLENNNIFMKIVKGSVFTFIPLHYFRQNWRGFNQSFEIAKLLSQHFGVKCLNLIGKIKYTKHQVGLKRGERKLNIKGSFNLNKHCREYQVNKVILVDDVMTTGSTLEEGAKILKEVGVKYVYGLVIARG